jgi:predicted signal transduction protein with EAL and GGDEF domain
MRVPVRSDRLSTMSDVEEVLRRVRDDPVFAARLGIDPATVLRPYVLERDDLRAIERAIADGGLRSDE